MTGRRIKLSCTAPDLNWPSGVESETWRFIADSYTQQHRAIDQQICRVTLNPKRTLWRIDPLLTWQQSGTESSRRTVGSVISGVSTARCCVTLRSIQCRVRSGSESSVPLSPEDYQQVTPLPPVPYLTGNNTCRRYLIELERPKSTMVQGLTARAMMSGRTSSL